MTQLSAESRRAVVIALAQTGCAPAEIEKKTGLPRASIYNDLRVARAKGVSIPDFPKRGGGVGQQRLVVALETLAALEAPAAAHGTTARALGARLLAILSHEPVLIENLLEEDEAHG